MTNVFMGLTKEEWSASAIQVAILAANAYFLTQNKLTVLSYWSLGLSILLILSLISLQTISRRFRILHPHRSDFNIKTESIDTMILRWMIRFAIFFMVLGIANIDITLIDSCSSSCAYYAVSFVATILLLLIFPSCWAKRGRANIEKKIATKVKNVGQVQELRKCIFNDKHLMTITKELVYMDEDGIKTNSERGKPKIKVSYNCDVEDCPMNGKIIIRNFRTLA